MLSKCFQRSHIQDGSERLYNGVVFLLPATHTFLCICDDKEVIVEGFTKLEAVDRSDGFKVSKHDF